MMDAALAGNHTFENAETLAHNVAEWLCGLARASDRDLRGQPVWRIDAPASL